MLNLAKAENDAGSKAVVLGLGILAQTCGDLEAVDGYYGKSLQLDKGLGCKVGMANNYANLGI